MAAETAPSFPTDASHASDLDILKADLAALQSDLSSLGSHAGESARARVEQARLRLAEIAKTAKDKGLHARDQVRTQIEDHPFAAVGIAFGVGILLGAVIARR